MKVVVQRVSHAQVSIDEKVVGKIDLGLMLLVGIHEEDTANDVEYLAQKISKLRIFDDHTGKMNDTIKKVNGAILSISQFTLYAATKKGNRPSFVEAANAKKAIQLYQLFNDKLRALAIQVETGEFGATMDVSLTNCGPVTIILDTCE